MQLSYLSETPGIGGTLKNAPEDFVVEEICEDGTILELDKQIERSGETNETEEQKWKEGKFTHFILQKTNWSTADAIREIARRLHISQTRFNFAGTKDKNAITTQLVSVFGVPPEQVRELGIKDITINGAWPASEKVELGALLGNRFRIKVSGITSKNPEESEKTVARIYEEVGGKFPNYFGEQRFGSTRKNTHIVGKFIITGDFEGAVMEYLASSEGEINNEAKAARKELAENKNFRTALTNFPKHLRLERSMLAHLAEEPDDYIGSLRRLPRNILLMFVHAFQSMLFNEMLSERIRESGKEIEPEEGEHLEDGSVIGKLIGYETETNEREEGVLQRYGIRRSNFRIKAISEISSKGSWRPLFAQLKDFEFSKNSKDVAVGRTDFSFNKNTETFTFSLPAGSYATMALREFIDAKKDIG